MASVCALWGERQWIMVHSFQKCLLWLSGGMGPYREVHPSVDTCLHPSSFTASSVSMISALLKHPTAFRTHQGELNLKTSHFLGSDSVLSTSLSTLSLWDYRAEGFAEAEIPLRPQKVAETSLHVRIRRGV